MENIEKHIKEISGELPEGVKLVAVSKFHPVESLRAAYKAGQRIFGESRVQEIKLKHEVMPADVAFYRALADQQGACTCAIRCANTQHRQLEVA